MTTFTEYLTKTKPKYAFLAREIQTAIGRQPDWQDLTKSNFLLVKSRLLETKAPNSVRTYMANLASVMNQVSEDVQLPKNYTDAMKIKKEASTAVYLTETEIERLAKVRSNNPNERYAYNMFLLQYYTGCRYSDACNLDETNIQDEQLSYVSSKTKIAVTMPVKPIVVDLIRELRTLSTPVKVTYILKIKELCYKAGIRQESKIFKGGKSVTEPKYKLVGTHTARRSFATNLILRGADIYTVSKLMGHSSIEMTMRYICAQITLNEKLLTFFK